MQRQMHVRYLPWRPAAIINSFSLLGSFGLVRRRSFWGVLGLFEDVLCVEVHLYCIRHCFLRTVVFTLTRSWSDTFCTRRIAYRDVVFPANIVRYQSVCRITQQIEPRRCAGVKINHAVVLVSLQNPSRCATGEIQAVVPLVKSKPLCHW